MAVSSLTPQLPARKLFIAIVAGMEGILAGVLLFFCIKINFFRKSKTPKAIRHETIELRQFQLEELDKATKSFSQEYLVGSGAFGNVYKGEIDDMMLAIKKPQADSYEGVEEFRNEVELLSRVKHRNLVGLVGYCQEQDEKILVYEYIPHGSLLEYIVGRGKKTLTWRQRVDIAIGAAKGIAHLHEGVQPSIIHRDIKPSNILIGNGFEAKVSDFGLVKTGPIGDASHLVTGKPALDTWRSHSPYHIIDWARPSLEKGIVEDIIDAKLLLEACNVEMMLKMGQLGLRCVAKSPKNRPTMSQVARELEKALHSVLSSANKQPSKGSHASLYREESQSFSIDGYGFHRFHVDTDGLSIHSAHMRCLDVNSIGSYIDKGDLAGISAEHDGSSATIST